MCAYKNVVNGFVEAIAAFVARPEIRQTALPKELNTTNINRKEAALIGKIDLPFNSFFFNCESNQHFAATISFDYVSIPAPSQVLTIICGKIFCEHCHL